MLAYIWRIVSFARRISFVNCARKDFAISQPRSNTTASRLLDCYDDKYVLRFSPHAVPYDWSRGCFICHFHGHDAGEAYALILDYLRA